MNLQQNWTHWVRWTFFKGPFTSSGLVLSHLHLKFGLDQTQELWSPWERGSVCTFRCSLVWCTSLCMHRCSMDQREEEKQKTLSVLLLIPVELKSSPPNRGRCLSHIRLFIFQTCEDFCSPQSHLTWCECPLNRSDATSVQLQVSSASSVCRAAPPQQLSSKDPIIHLAVLLEAWENTFTN